jgi:predicted ATP-binding protein involved in virulence
MEDKLIDKYGNKHGYTYFAQHKNGMRIHYSMLGDGDKLLYDMVYHLCLIKEDHLPSRQKRDLYLFFIDNIDFFSTGRGNAKILDVLSKSFPQITFVGSTKSRELVNEVLALYEENNYLSDALNILSFTKNDEDFSASVINHAISETYLVSPSI